MCIYYLILAFPFIGCLCSDVEFSVETDYSEETRCSIAVQQNIEPEWSGAVEQTLTVFIFTQYTDPFRSQITDFISEVHLPALSRRHLKVLIFSAEVMLLNVSGSEEFLEGDLDAVLWYNGDQVRATLQSTMKKTLKGFQQRRTVRFVCMEFMYTTVQKFRSVISIYIFSKDCSKVTLKMFIMLQNISVSYIG